MEELNGITGDNQNPDNQICPFCENGHISLKKEERTLSFRGEDYTIEYLFFECNLVKEHSFTKDKTDDVWLADIHKQYRDRHPDGPPTATELAQQSP